MPAAAYVPFVRTGILVFISGHIAREGKPWVGQLGLTMGTDEGKAAARAIAIELMGTLQAAVGDLDKITRIVKLMSLVNSTPTFTEQHLVTNGSSELLGEVFGAAGRARAQRLRRGADPDGCLRRDRADRRTGVSDAAGAGSRRACRSARRAVRGRWRWAWRWSRSTSSTCSPARGACCSA